MEETTPGVEESDPRPSEDILTASTADPPSSFSSFSSSSSSSLLAKFSSAYSSLPPTPCEWLPAFRGRLLQGTCGWTDASILKGRHFYPSHVHTAVERLRHYSASFPCVEVDSSNYAIPPPSRVASWVAVTPPHFLFHFKVYGLFTLLSIRSDAIPGPLRDHLPPSLTSTPTIRLSALPPSFTDLLWSYWNFAILPAHTSARLGLVIFQFQLSFKPSAAHRLHVEWCRTHLLACYRMAVEFRDRRWLQGDELPSTRQWLSAMDVTLICEDDLAQETYRPNMAKVGDDHRLPILLTPTSSHSLYVRLHRRVGDNRGDRVLKEEEFREWGERLREVRKEEGGGDRAVFFLWGTDCWDDPVVNARALEREVKGEGVWMDWVAMQRERSRGQGGGNLLALFQRQVETSSRKEEAGKEEAKTKAEGEEDVQQGGTGEAPVVDENAAFDSTPSQLTGSDAKRGRDVDGGERAAKRQRTTVAASPSRAPKPKMTATDRKAAAGKISSFFSKQPP